MHVVSFRSLTTRHRVHLGAWCHALSSSFWWPLPAALEGAGAEALLEASRGLLSALSPQPSVFPTDPGHGDEKQQAFPGLFVYCLGHIKIFLKVFLLVVFTTSGYFC